MLTSTSSRYTVETFTDTALGMTMSLSPLFTIPASVLPITIVPMSLCLSRMGMRNGASGFRSSGSRSSRVSKNDLPSYQGHTSLPTVVFMLVPYRPETGTYCTSLGW